MATFSSVRSANRSARVAERSLMAGLAPVLIPSREGDTPQFVRFGDGHIVELNGRPGAVVATEEVLYLALALRNGGSGVAVMHGWRAHGGRESAVTMPRLDEFRLQQLDLYIPAGDSGHWLGALRDPSEPAARSVRSALDGDDVIQLDLLYGDHEGGQRTIARFLLAPWAEGEGRRAIVLRYWNVDRDDPRRRPDP